MGAQALSANGPSLTFQLIDLTGIIQVPKSISLVDGWRLWKQLQNLIILLMEDLSFRMQDGPQNLKSLD